MNLFLTQFRHELRKLFARKRTWLGFGAFLGVECVILLLLQLPKVQRSWKFIIERAGYGFEQYFSGITLGFQVLIWTIFFLGALYVSLVAGDIVAKEVEDGTLRMTLCRPISRVRLLLIKYLTCVFYTFLLIFFVGLSALAVGTAKEGVGAFFVFQPLQNLFALYDTGPGHLRFIGSLPLLSLSMLSVTTIAFMLSCWNMKPAAATIATLTYFMADGIFRRIPYFEDIKQWFLTTHMESWDNAFRAPVPVAQIIGDYSYLLAVDATLVIIAVVAFQARDFKS
ncbi:MAG: ABC transporter permease [Chthoniobacteraceae bacterium]